MKFVAFCLLLVFATYVIYQQRQQINGLNAALVSSSGQIERLEKELEQVKMTSAEAAPTSEPGQAQRPAKSNNSWMYENRQNALGAPSLGGSHGR